MCASRSQSTVRPGHTSHAPTRTAQLLRGAQQGYHRVRGRVCKDCLCAVPHRLQNGETVSSCTPCTHCPCGTSLNICEPRTHRQCPSSGTVCGSISGRRCALSQLGPAAQSAVVSCSHSGANFSSVLLNWLAKHVPHARARALCRLVCSHSVRQYVPHSCGGRVLSCHNGGRRVECASGSDERAPCIPSQELCPKPAGK